MQRLPKLIKDESFKQTADETAVDTPVYEAWVKHYIGGTSPVSVSWVSADA
ncbi:MAG: hypothetical protein IK079_01685 [Desulfovibrio sp.]|nr:hypothetical protein [Desulfovibrio sp.]